MNVGVAAPRRFSSWVDTYLEYTDILPSPALFRKWAAISFVAAAMERRLWVRTMGSNLYPSLYVLLVGPPGVGKGQSIHLGETILRAVPNLHVSPSDMTAASLIDALHESVRHFVTAGTPPILEFNSLTIISRELGVLIPGWDNALMNNLTDIYDGFTVDQKRRGKDLRIKIPSPQINLLGACTPSYLNETLPAGAWDQGFISRTMLIYSGEAQHRDPFSEDSQLALTSRLHADLLHDLKTIASLWGQLYFTKPAAAAVKAWIANKCPPEPTHNKLQYYNARRIAHLLKLCMISSISRSNDKTIGIEHYTEALNWLVEAESYMPDIFKSMVSGGDSSAMDEAWEYIYKLYIKEKQAVAEHRLVNFLRDRVPAHGITRMIDVMARSKMFDVIPGEGGPYYKPNPKRRAE